MKKINSKLYLELFIIALGCAIYGFGIDAISIPNRLADGGLTGITLILFHWWQINPGLSTLILNIPLIIIGYRYLGKRLFWETVWGTLCLSFFLWMWRYVPIIKQLNLEHDLFLSAISVGILSGFGLGLVFRFNGTTGGTDIIVRIFQMQFGIASSRTLFALDAIVLTLSLSYLDLKHMLYTLLASFVVAQVMELVQQGAYRAVGVFIISDKYKEIGKMIDLKLERGFTYIKAEGGYKLDDKRIIYCIISPREIPLIKSIVLQEDPHAFMSIFDVHEALGEGFSYARKRTMFFRK